MRNRRTVVTELIRAQRESELIVRRCAELREEVRQLAENLQSGFMEPIPGEGTVTVAWRGEGRPLVFVHLE